MFVFVVPVWGPSFSALFVDVCLPMLLTPGNLGTPLTNQNDRFVIATTLADAAFMRDAPAFRKLEAVIAVEFVIIDGRVKLNNPYVAMSACYAMVVNDPRVVPGSTCFVFLTPDGFWSDGTFARLRSLADDGVNVVAAAGLRVNLEAVSEPLKSWIAANPENAAIARSDLIDLVLDNLHQISRANDWMERNSFNNKWPSHVYWIDRIRHQLIGHCFHLHPLLVRAGRPDCTIGDTIDGEYLANLGYSIDTYHVDRGEFVGVELSPTHRKPFGDLGSPSIERVADFARLHCNDMHRHFFRQRIVLKHDHEEVSSELDEMATEVSDAIMAASLRPGASLPEVYNAGLLGRILRRLRVELRRLRA
jgi:hypothetical protein